MDADTPVMESGSTASADPVSMFEAALGRSFGEAPPEEGKAPAAEAAPEAEDPPVDPDSQDDPEQRTYKVKVDGQEIEVAEDELLKGYSRQQDYTKKTMELAQQRQQIDQVAAQANAERAQYQSQLQQLSAALGQQLSAPPDVALLDSDPVEYMRQQHLYTQRQAAFQNAQQEMQRNEYYLREQQQMTEQQRLASEREQLIANLPDWADDAKAAEEKALITKTLSAMGRTPEQMQKLDHIDVLVARKAMLYDQMIAKAKETTKKVETLPPRMQKPGAVTKTTDGRTADMQALKRTGRVDAAAALFEKML